MSTPPATEADWPPIEAAPLLQTVPYVPPHQPAAPAEPLQQLRAPSGRVAPHYHGMNHAWSGGSSTEQYADPSGPSETDAMYVFFANHPLP